MKYLTGRKVIRRQKALTVLLCSRSVERADVGAMSLVTLGSLCCAELLNWPLSNTVVLSGPCE